MMRDSPSSSVYLVIHILKWIIVKEEVEELASFSRKGLKSKEILDFAKREWTKGLTEIITELEFFKGKE